MNTGDIYRWRFDNRLVVKILSITDDEHYYIQYGCESSVFMAKTIFHERYEFDQKLTNEHTIENIII